MTAYIDGEVSIFLWSVVSGIVIMVAYDIFSVLTNNKSFSVFVCNIFDGIFVLCASTIMIFIMFNISNGYIRSFEFVGAGIGILIYKITLSRLISTVFLKVINFVISFFEVFLKILLTPIRFMYKIMYNGVSMLVKTTAKLLLPLKRQLSLMKVSIKKT